MWIFSRKKIRDKKAPSSTARGGIKKTAKVDSEIKAKTAEVKSMKDLYSSAEQAKTKEEKGPGKKIFKYQQAPKILVRPLVTEKVSNLGADNKYGRQKGQIRQNYRQEKGLEKSHSYFSCRSNN